MDRRELIKKSVAYSSLIGTAGWLYSALGPQERPAYAAAGPNEAPFRLSSPVRTQYDGQVIEHLAIEAEGQPGILISHRRVTVRQCKVRHRFGPGILARRAPGLILENCEFDHTGAPESGPTEETSAINVALEASHEAIIRAVKASRGASNLYAVNCRYLQLSQVEFHDARGLEPRGQNIQLDKCPRATIDGFSVENGPQSWTEDNISIFHSDGCTLRNGLVSYNNSPTGDGVMLEGSSACLVEDVDAVQQGNGAFAAVPQGARSSNGCRFVRCRTRDSYNARRDGREAPTSKGLSFYTIASPGAALHSIEDCQYFRVANPNNLIWKTEALAHGWSLNQSEFEARRPVRISLPS